MKKNIVNVIDTFFGNPDVAKYIKSGGKGIVAIYGIYTFCELLSKLIDKGYTLTCDYEPENSKFLVTLSPVSLEATSVVTLE